MVHLNRLALGLDAARCKQDHRARLQDTRLNTPNRDSPNARDLVDVLQRKTQRLLNGMDRLWTLSTASWSVGLVPRHVLQQLNRVVTVEARDGDN